MVGPPPLVVVEVSPAPALSPPDNASSLLNIIDNVSGV